MLENGITGLRESVLTDCNYYAREAEIHAKRSKFVILITVVISIVSIVGIGSAIAPMMTQAEHRRHISLLFFLKVPKIRLPTMIQNCQYCLKMSDGERYSQIVSDYQDYLRVTLDSEDDEDEKAEKVDTDKLFDISEASQNQSLSEASVKKEPQLEVVVEGEDEEEEIETPKNPRIGKQAIFGQALF